VLCIIYYIFVLTHYSAGTIYRRVEQVHMPGIEDSRLVPFNIDIAYAAGRDTPHGRYVKMSIIFC
jgi:hypothetical protein